MALKVNEGHVMKILGVESAVDIYDGGKVRVFTAPIPTSAGGAETGTFLYDLTNNGESVAKKQKIRFTPTAGTASAGVWFITLKGVSAKYTDDGSPTPAEICTGLYNAWRAASGLVAVSSPACSINVPAVYQKFAFTDGSGYLEVESATAGVPFLYESGVSGAGAGTGSWSTTIIQADACGLQFERDIVDGYMRVLDAMVVKGTAIAGGQPAYYRLVARGDTGAISSSEPRMQGTVGTSSSFDMKVNHATVDIGEKVEPSRLRFKIPIS